MSESRRAERSRPVRVRVPLAARLRRSVRPAPVQPATRPVPSSVAWPVTHEVRPPVLSPDGAWLWTGSAWVPAWWVGAAPPPPRRPPVPQGPARSHGCAAGLGAGCLLALAIVAPSVIVGQALAGGLGVLLATALVGPAMDSTAIT